MEEIIAHWGYSYLRRDELLDISTWKSWREDPRPLHLAVANLRKMPSTPTIPERVSRAKAESEARFPEIADAMRASGGRPLARVFTACVRASRRLFPLKDDRDLVLSHAQAAVRWVLCEAGRRWTRAGALAKAEEIFLLRPEEIAAGAAGQCDPQEIADMAQQRREEQRRFARYTPPQALVSLPTASADGEMFQGVPANAGIAEGPIRIITTERVEEIGQLRPGEILWLQGEGKVGWTMYFPLLAGLIYEGNWLCHETNLCRELGIPAVLIAIRDLPGLRTGERVRIDGGKGTVCRLL